jgi:hypothetical protein
MSINNIVEWAEDLVFTHTGEHLDDLQRAILREAFQGQKYAKIAQDRSITEGHVRDSASQLWKILSDALGENIKKSNLRSTIERLHYANISVGSKVHIGDIKVCGNGSPVPKSSKKEREPPQIDLGLAPEVSCFYGRREELETLESWVSCSRLILLLGLPGIGKTSLALKLIDRIQTQFDRILYYSLQFSPPLTATLTYLLQVLTDSEEVPHQLEAQHEALLKALKRDRLLILLDDMQTLFAPQQSAGHYYPNLENYRTFFQLLGQVPHQSCIILISDEQPKEQKTNPILRLNGLGNHTTDIFRHYQLLDEEDWETLSHRYHHHPLWLTGVSQLIQDLFQGNVHKFLEQDILLIDSIQDQYQRRFNRLSDLEQELLQDMAQFSAPVGLGDLLKGRSQPATIILHTLQSLQRRLWIETEETPQFTLSPLTMTYLKLMARQ